MGSDTESEPSLEGEVEVVNSRSSSSHWGKAKHDYYYTDYIDKDYPSKLSSKEERSARIEQDEALRIQKKLLSTLDNLNIEPTFDVDESKDAVGANEKATNGVEFDLIDFLEKQNKSIDSQFNSIGKPKKRKRVVFEDEAEDSDDDGDSFVDSEDDDDHEEEDIEDEQHEISNQSGKDRKKVKVKETAEDSNSRRRPINIAMKKNRGLTPYKKKEYRNPRVKHKNKYRKAMSKRRRNVREAQVEYHRYSGEANGIKTSTIKSIKLC